MVFSGSHLRWLFLVALLFLSGSLHAQLQYDLRIAGGGNQHAQTLTVGETITIQVYAVVSGTDATANEAFQYGYGTLMSQAGTLKGTLSTVTLNSPFNANGSSIGATSDINGDGIADIGGTGSTPNASFIQARAQGQQTGGTRVGNNTEFLLGSVTFTVDNSTLNEMTSSTSFNFLSPTFISPTRPALFQSDGVTKNDLNGTINSGTTMTGTGITFSVGDAVAYWKGGQGTGGQTSSWATDILGATNFTTDATGAMVSQTLPGDETEVVFQATGATGLATTLDGDRQIRKLTFNSTVTGSVSISGNTLTIGSGGIEAQAGTGSHLVNSNVALATSQSWTVNSTNPLTVSGVVSGASTAALTKDGTGVLVLNGASANTFAGATNVSSGSLELRKTGALGGTSAVNLNGGTLLLAGTGNNRINSTAAVNFNGGGLASARAATAGSTISESVGVLTLSVSSTLDFGAFTAGQGNTSLTFADTNGAAWTGTLTITNWQGNYDGTAASSASSDHLFLTSTGNLLGNGQLAQIQFLDSSNGIHTAVLLGNEIVAGDLAIPEPSTVAAALLLVGAIGWRERRRFGSLCMPHLRWPVVP